ncbi:MAG: CBS domain-containing protein [Acidobacteriia bacterium]|nr:CBS domain-containing protein [Terriglobia bacterium]
MTEKSTAVQRAPSKTSLTAQDVMQRPVIAATPRASLRDVASQLVANEFTGMPVVAPDGRVVGVITESDIVHAVLQGKRLENLSASDVMTGPPIAVKVDAPLEEVMKHLDENRIVRVPVTNDDALVGIISRRDVIRAILEPEFIVCGGL